MKFKRSKPSPSPIPVTATIPEMKLVTDIVTVICSFNENQTITAAEIGWLTDNKQEVYTYLLAHPHREFAISVLQQMVVLRRERDGALGIHDIMFACLLVAIHRQIEDCLLIWKAKYVDFDAYCCLDIQLVAFMGVDSTISYLQMSTDPAATEALEYILECQEGDDFDELDHYLDGLTKQLLSF